MFFRLTQGTRLMASSRTCLDLLRVAVIAMFIVFATLLSSTSVGSVFLRDSGGLKQTKLVLGSRPPRCVNKCFSCRPCMAALVVPPHHKSGVGASTQEDESYYLLTWKCKCGDKFFKP